MANDFKFKDFEDFFDGISKLHQKDGKNLLFLSSNDKRINCFIALDENKPLSDQLEQLACNIQAYSNHSITSPEKQYVSFRNETIPLIKYGNIEFANNVSKEKMAPISEISSKIKQEDMSAYIANAVYKNKINTQISPEQFEILKYYKAEGYEFINSFLGNGEIKARGSEKEKITPEFCNKLMLLDKAFEENKPLEEDLVVYRGTKNQETDHFSFISTSLSQKVAAENFSSNNIYEIHLPKGTHVLSLDNIAGLRNSESEAEAEILLRPSTFINQSQNGNKYKVDVKENSFSELLLDALERRKDEYLKNKSPEDAQQYLESIDYVRSIVGNNHNNTSTRDNEQSYDSLMSSYTKLLENPSSSPEELWNVANKLEQKDNSGEYVISAAIGVVERNPKYNHQEMLSTINGDVFKNKPSDDLTSEIISYGAAAQAVGRLAENNKDLDSNCVFQTLNKTSREVLGCQNITDDVSAVQTSAAQIIESYGKCNYNTPKQAQQALDNISQLSRISSFETIKSVHSVLNSGVEQNKDVAQSAFQALSTVKPENAEEASKMLSMYAQISQDNPELAEASINKIHSIFGKFSINETIQKECLSTLETLNGSKGHFDEEIQGKLNRFIKSEKNNIAAQTVLRSQGRGTTWQPETTQSNSRDRELSQMEKFHSNNKNRGDPQMVKGFEMEMGR